MSGTSDIHIQNGGSYELEELLASPSLDSQQKEAKDATGKLIVDKYLEHHHHSNRTTTSTHANATNNAMNNNPKGKHGKTKNAKKLDEYGFIVNIDEKGNLRSEDSFYLYGGASTPAMDYNHNAAAASTTPTSSHQRFFESLNGRVNGGNAHGSGQKRGIIRGRNQGNSNGHHNQNNHQSWSGAHGNNSNGMMTTIKMSPSDPSSIAELNKDPTNSNTSTNSNNNNNYTKNQRREIRMQQKLLSRREKKWKQMLQPAEYKAIKASKPKRKKLYSRVRKGIPNSIRGKAWVTMAGVNIVIQQQEGVYAKLVEQSCRDRDSNAADDQLEGIHEALLPFVVDIKGESGDNENGENGTSGEDGNEGPTNAMKETIERDINRTFPRHSMFYDSYSDSDSDSDDDDDDDDDGLASAYADSNEFANHDPFGAPGNRDNNNNNNNNNSNMNKKGGKKLYGALDGGDDDDGELSDESFDKVSFSGSLGSTGHGFSSDVAVGIADHDLSDFESQPPTNNTNLNAASGVSGDITCWSRPARAFNKAAANCPPMPCIDSKKENALVVPTTNNNGNNNRLPPSHNTTPSRKEKKKVDFTKEEGGQASLRRVLRAYSLYDPEVGYCQGMNFIAGMFITFVSEEEAFWLLVYVMNQKPCRMRGLFGVGMSEAHQVLHVAERLIAQFNPKLSRHFDKENIHVTMFATQWLLTMFTSSFPFHIVTRIWDCFILEGWKVAYRFMLALLDKATPDLLKLRFEDILNYFKVMPFQIDVNSLVKMSFNVPLKKKHIEKYAKEWMQKQKNR